MDEKATALADLRRIPGVGRRVAEDLWDLGYRSTADLRDEDPEQMYRRLEARAGAHVDRCMLYTFRCAVYFASNERQDPALLKWWNWKDRP